MQKFEVGKKYRGHGNNVYECTKKSEKSVWFDGHRFELKTDTKGCEYTTSIYRVKDIDARRPVEYEEPDAKEKAQKLYVVCVNAYWVRDTQVFNVDGLGPDMDEDCLSDEEHDGLWFDVKEPLFVGTAKAGSCEEACRAVAESNTEYPLRCLYAFPVCDRKEDGVCSR